MPNSLPDLEENRNSRSQIGKGKVSLLEVSPAFKYLVTI
jgi:hypothetical protein